MHLSLLMGMAMCKCSKLKGILSTRESRLTKFGIVSLRDEKSQIKTNGGETGEKLRDVAMAGSRGSEPEDEQRVIPERRE